MDVENKKIVRIFYTNYKGEKGHRNIIPERIWFGSTEWHNEQQWLLDAWDVEKEAIRNFALKDIGEWIAE